jgi:hypothetical protein
MCIVTDEIKDHFPFRVEAFSFEVVLKANGGNQQFCVH